MPLAEKLMASLVARYGRGKAEQVYWGMVGEGKGPFGPRGKYRDEHEDWANRVGVTIRGEPVPKKRARRRR